MATIDTYAVGNASPGGPQISGGANLAVGQSFYNNSADRVIVDSIYLNIAKVGTVTGTITIGVYAHGGTYGTSSVPALPLVGANSYPITSLTTTYTLRSYVTAGGTDIILEPFTHYFLYIAYAGGDGSNYVSVSGDVSSPSHGGNFAYLPSGGGSWTSDPTVDMIFTVNGTPVAVPQNATLGLDSGSPIPDLPGDPGYAIYGGWGSAIYGISYAGSGSNLSSPEIGGNQAVIGITSDNVDFTQDYHLTVADAAIGITSESPVTAVEQYLVVQDAAISLTAENVIILYLIATALADPSTIGITSETPSLAQDYHLTVQDATLGTISATPTMVYDQVMTIADSTIGTTSDTPTFFQDYMLVSNDAFISLSAESTFVYIEFSSIGVDNGTFQPRAPEEGEILGLGDVENGTYQPRHKPEGEYAVAAGADTGSWEAP